MSRKSDNFTYTILGLLYFPHSAEEYFNQIAEHQEFDARKLIKFLEEAPVPSDYNAKNYRGLSAEFTSRLLKILYEKTRDPLLILKVMLKKNVRVLLDDLLESDTPPEFFHEAFEALSQKEKLKFLLIVLRLTKKAIGGFAQAHVFCNMATYMLIHIGTTRDNPVTDSLRHCLFRSLLGEKLNDIGAWEGEDNLDEYITLVKHLTQLIK